jgi:hypothetical protein
MSADSTISVENKPREMTVDETYYTWNSSCVNYYK